MNATNNLWDKHQKQWDALGSPLRPVATDLQLFNRAIREWAERHAGEPACVFVMGVTPEFPGLDWPEGSRVYALDKSINMIRYIWPAGTGCAAGTVAMDWLAVPLKAECADIIIGDGCFTLISWPDACATLLVSIAGLLKPDGRLLMRFFIRPDRPEDPETVFADLLAGRIGNFHVFKWRLAMALQGDDATGVNAGRIWEAWNARGFDEGELAARLGWPTGAIATIHAYRDSPQMLSFPSLGELQELLAPCLEVISCAFPQHELGNRCPVFSLQRKK